jgi:hypothetical protein
MNTFDAINTRLQSIRDEIKTIPLSIAESQTVPDNLKQYAPAIVNQKMQEKADRALQAVSGLIDRKAQELDELYKRTADEYRRTRFPLTTSTSPVKREEGRFLEGHAYKVVDATVKSEDSQALVDAMQDASTLEDVELWSWLVMWTALLWKSKKIEDAEKLSGPLGLYNTFTNSSEYKNALSEIYALKKSILSQRGILDAPTLFNPSTAQAWELSLQRQGLA